MLFPEASTNVALRVSVGSHIRMADPTEATAALERAVDLFSAAIAMDPAEVRRRNLVDATVFPYRNATGAIYDSGD